MYFRVADGPPDGYYVDMKSDTPCFSGILPRPKKELIGRRVAYYLDAVDRAFAESRTTEADPLVVKSESECEDRLLAAPWLDKATVAVFPGMPAGFAGGGLGAGATAAIVGGGAAVIQDPKLRSAYVATKIAVFLAAAALTWPLSRTIGPKAWIGLAVFGFVLVVLTLAVLLGGGTAPSAARQPAGSASPDEDELPPNPEGPGEALPGRVRLALPPGRQRGRAE